MGNFVMSFHILKNKKRGLGFQVWTKINTDMSDIKCFYSIRKNGKLLRFAVNIILSRRMYLL